MSFSKSIKRRIELANIIVFACLFIFIYFDKTILGIGITFTLSGLLSIAAFIHNAGPLWMSLSTEIIFKWLFENYSKKALNLVYGVFSLVIGIASLVTELR